MKRKKYHCPTCRKKFLKLRDLNDHITKTGCNDGEKITPLDFFDKKTMLKALIEES